MFATKRPFRAIVCSSSLRSIDELLSRFPTGTIERDGEPPARAKSQPDARASNDSTSLVRVHFVTSKAYIDAELLDEIKVKRGNVWLYRYEMFICRYTDRRDGTLVVAVPFSGMARDVFGIVEDKMRGAKRHYKKINLDSLAKLLAEESSESLPFTATSVRFRVAGTDSVAAAVMTGTSVIPSETYSRIMKSLHGLRLVPQKIRFRFCADSAKTSCETDAHGNFLLRAGRSGSGLVAMSHMLRALEKTGVIETTLAYPLSKDALAGNSDD